MKIFPAISAPMLMIGLLSNAQCVKADTIDRVIAVEKDARTWAEQHATEQFRANSEVRGCIEHQGDYADCKAVGDRLEVLATKAVGVQRLAFETLGDMVLTNAAGMELQAEPEGLTYGAVAAIADADLSAEKARLRAILRDAKGLDAASVVKYAHLII